VRVLAHPRGYDASGVDVLAGAEAGAAAVVSVAAGLLSAVDALLVDELAADLPPE
jgi:hypothetical protein